MKKVSVVNQILLGFCFVLTAQSAFATPSLQKKFLDNYLPNNSFKADTVNCATCHKPMVKDGLNFYAIDLNAAFAKGSVWEFTTPEALDSDGDGVKNIDEILAGTNPGSQTTAADQFSDAPFVFHSKMANVTFDHDKHSMDDAHGVKGNCVACHGSVAGAPGFFPKIFDDRVLNKDTAHALCKTCHVSSGNANAPTTCVGCHVK